jgi:hypothetical protein
VLDGCEAVYPMSLVWVFLQQQRVCRRRRGGCCCVCVGVVVVFLLLECVVCVQKRVRLLVLIVVGGGGCRFANSLAYNAPTTCSFAEFSSKWRNGFLNFVAHPLTARLSKSGVRRTALMAGAVV